MNKENLSTLQVFQSFSRKGETLFLQSYPKSLSGFSANVKKSAQKKPAKLEKTWRGQFSKQSSVAVSKNNNLEGKKGRFGIWKIVKTHRSKYSSRQYPFVLTWSSFFSSMLLCTTKTNLNTQAVTKQELPRNWVDPIYQNDSLKKEVNKKLFAKEEILLDKILSCPRVKLLYSHTSKLKTGWCRNWIFILRLCSTTSS